MVIVVIKICGNMCKKSFAERRAILNKIPEGIYCYTPLSYENGVYGVSPCPYWKRIGKQRAKCTLYNIKDKYQQDCTTLLWDQCKVCGLRENFNDH